MNEHVPLVYIVILNYNNFEDTIGCLDSVSKISYSNYKILVLDNASQNDSVDRIQEWMIRHRKGILRLDEDSLSDYKKECAADFILIAKHENNGYAGGNNAGIKFAIENGADYIWVLNNDTTVHPSALTELVKIAERYPGVGLVGSKIYFLDHPDRIWFSSGHYYYSADKRDRVSDELEKEVRVISGCSFLINKELVKGIGFLWEGFFLYFEEDDFCMRAKKEGWKIYFSPKSKVYHKVSGSVRDSSPLFTYYKARNYMIYTLRNDIEPLLLSFLFTIKEHLLPCLIRLKFNHIKYLFKAYKDFFKIYWDKSYK